MDIDSEEARSALAHAICVFDRLVDDSAHDLHLEDDELTAAHEDQ